MTRTPFQSIVQLWRFLLAGLLCTASAVAQSKSFMYQDESGNIYFADSIDRIPIKYRSQVIPPSPTPYMSAKDYDKYLRDYNSGRLQKRLEREQQKIKKDKEREERKKQKDELRKQREKEREERRNKSKDKKEKQEKTDRRGGTRAEVSSSVELYVAGNCPDCREAERLLSRHAVEYTKYDVERSEVGKKFYTKVGGGDLPMLFAAGKVLKGYNKEAIARMLGFELSPQEQNKK